MPAFQQPELIVQIGGFTSNVTLKTPFLFLGCYRCIRGVLTNNIIDLLYRHGHALGKFYDILDKTQLRAFRPMTAVLAQHPLFDWIIPLFAKADTMSPRFLEGTVDLLAFVGKTAGLDDVPVVASLLRKSSPRILTYSLWQKFEGLLETSRNESLLHSVVLNFEIWSVAPFTEQQRILRLLPSWIASLPPALAEAVAFRRILAGLRMFYWSDPCETTIIERDSRRDPALDLGFCREKINDFLIQLSSIHFTERDARSVVSHALSCRDDAQVVSLLSLLRALPRFPGADPQFAVLFLNRLPSAKSQLFVELAVTILILGDRYPHSKMVAAKLCANHYSGDVLAFLLPHLGHFPELLSIFCLVAANVGAPAAGQFCEVLTVLANRQEFQRAILEVPHWYVWPLLASLHFATDVREAAVGFVHSVVRLDRTIGLCDRVFGFCNFLTTLGDSGDVWLAFLARLLADCPDRDQFAFELIPRVLLMLFFSGPSMYSEGMHETMRTSPFALRTRPAKPFLKSIGELAAAVKSAPARERR
jgi:hypothetical protein